MEAPPVCTPLPLLGCEGWGGEGAGGRLPRNNLLCARRSSCRSLFKAASCLQRECHSLINKMAKRYVLEDKRSVNDIGSNNVLCIQTDQVG